MRIEGKCFGDCSKCELLQNGKVDMIPCILDQIFHHIKKLESSINNIKEPLIAEFPEEK